MNATPIGGESSAAFGPVKVGLRAARANLVPGIVIQLTILAVVLGYHTSEGVRAWLAVLAGWKEAYGFFYAAAAGVVAGAVLPELLVIGFFQRGRWRRENGANLLFGIPFWAANAVMVDLLYRGQALWFGADGDLTTVALKVCFDQFVYTPFVSLPIAVVLLEWKERGYAVGWMKHVPTLEYYRVRTLPSVIAAWGVWLPVVMLVYSLPSLLQLPVFSLALTFWSLMITWIAKAQALQVAR